MSDLFHIPEPGELWRHYKGSLYLIIGMAIDASTGRPTVVYADDPRAVAEAAGRTYTRDLGEFLGFTDAHQQRFVREGASRAPG
jgi:hypothetical protein